MKALKFIGIVLLVFVLANAWLVVRFYQGKQSASEHNATLLSTRLQIPEVDSMTVMPIVDSVAADQKLQAEDALSYLVKAGEDQILLDVGWNQNQLPVSPTKANLKHLRIDPAGFTALVISHNHPDHVGGMGFRENRITTDVNIGSIPVFTPVAMTLAHRSTTRVVSPRMVGQTIGVTGPIEDQMYVPGRIAEQALLVNVKGKGLVLISGCGHPRINAMVDAAERITGKPVYAVVGGTHLYYTSVKSAFWRRIMGSTKLFAAGNNREDVEQTILALKQHRVRQVSISGHDADQATLDLFNQYYGADSAAVIVGKPITY